MIEFVLIALLICLLYFWYQWYHKGPKFPPGPSQFSLDSQLVMFKKRNYETLKEMGQKYGSIFHVYFGRKYVIILNSYEAIREVMGRKGDCFLERPHVFMFDWYHNNEGLSFSHGENWRQQRTFLAEAFEKCGFGKTFMKECGTVNSESVIMNELQHLIEAISLYKGKSFNLHHLLERSIANVICTFLFDERYDYTDITIDKLLDCIEQFFDTFTPLNPINYFPPIRFISRTFKSFKKTLNFERNYFTSIVEQHDDTYHPEYHRNFVDVYLERIKADKINKVSNSPFTKGNLLKVLESLFIGVTPIASSLLWFIKLMIINPEKQQKLHDELDKHFTLPSVISLSDRPKIPYMEATILETHRLASIAPFTNLHISTEDVKVFNYVIPKDTVVLANLHAVHNDDKYWPNPKEFRPERFLDLEGKLHKDIEGLIPFSLGHRDCPAKRLSKNMLTLFIANLFHRYEFVTPENEPPPDINDYHEGLLLRPYPLNVCAKLR